MTKSDALQILGAMFLIAAAMLVWVPAGLAVAGVLLLLAARVAESEVGG